MVPRSLILAGVLAFCCPFLLGAPKWRPIELADRAAQPPDSEPAANGLTLLREISVDSSNRETTNFEYYVRTKVFNAAGVAALNKTEIPFARDLSPRDLAARVVKPDGRIVEVAPEAFYTREVVRVGHESASVKAFCFAALEPGDIAEYRYRIHNPELVLGSRLYLDDPFPTALARIRIGTISYPGLGLQSLWSHTAPFAALDQKRDNQLVFEARGLHSTVADPFPPPDDMIKPWFLFYYTFLDGTAQEYWSATGGELQTLAEAYLAPKKRLKEMVATLLAGASGEEESIGRLYEFCRTKIKNISHEGSGYTPDQIEKLKFNKSSLDTLNNGYGTATQINLLFGALLRASGRGCHLAYCGDRSLSFFDRNLKTSSALPHIVVAMDTCGWNFYDPGARYLPPGKLDWKNEDTTALAVANKRWQFVETPRASAAYSTTRRTADFTLSGDGTLEGDIAIALTGHAGFAARHHYLPKSPKERQDLIEKELVDRLGQVEITDCRVDPAADLTAPITIACHVKIRDYATQAGGRLLLPFAFFQKGVPELFPATERKSNIYFPYYATEEDKVSIHLPDGYALEPPDLLRAAGDGNKLHYSPRISLEAQGRRVVYERTYAIHLFSFPAARYPQLQKTFHDIAQQDSRIFSLCPASPVSPITTDSLPADAP